MKTLTFEYGEIVRAFGLLNYISSPACEAKRYSGIERARAIAEIANILDAGVVGEKGEKNSPRKKEVQANGQKGGMKDG